GRDNHRDSFQQPRRGLSVRSDGLAPGQHPPNPRTEYRIVSAFNTQSRRRQPGLDRGLDLIVMIGFGQIDADRNATLSFRTRPLPPTPPHRPPLSAYPLRPSRRPPCRGRAPESRRRLLLLARRAAPPTRTSHRSLTSAWRWRRGASPRNVTGTGTSRCFQS